MNANAYLVMCIVAAVVWLGGLGIALYNAMSIVAE